MFSKEFSLNPNAERQRRFGNKIEVYHLSLLILPTILILMTTELNSSQIVSYILYAQFQLGPSLLKPNTKSKCQHI